MRYRIIGEEITTHRRVELSNWEAPDTATAKQRAKEIGVVVSRIEPMSGATQEDNHDRRRTTFKTLSMVTPQTAVETNSYEKTAEMQYGDRLHTISAACTLVSLAAFVLLALVLIVNGAPGFLIVIGLLLGGGAIYAIRGIIYQVATCRERTAIEAEAKTKAERAKGARDGRLYCPHCQQFGCVATQPTMVKKGISGGKAMAALLTGGWSMLFTGLSQEDMMTKATCSNCGSTWLF
jgi:hypothetical protein